METVRSGFSQIQRIHCCLLPSSGRIRDQLVQGYRKASIDWTGSATHIRFSQREAKDDWKHNAKWKRESCNLYVWWSFGLTWWKFRWRRIAILLWECLLPVIFCLSESQYLRIWVGVLLARAFWLCCYYFMFRRVQNFILVWLLEKLQHNLWSALCLS